MFNFMIARHDVIRRLSRFLPPRRVGYGRTHGLPGPDYPSERESPEHSLAAAKLQIKVVYLFVLSKTDEK